MIETKKLTKQYGNLIAVKDLNLSIAQGELFSILGLNGAGKSTTIKMLTGLIKPTSGEARILDKDLISNVSAIKKEINISPQDTAVAPNLTVYENLKLIAGIYSISKEMIPDKIAEVMELFKLGDKCNWLSKKLSGGMKRRLSLAMAFITEPKILFLDEPTLGLDVLARRDLWAIIQKLKSRTTIILTSHYLEEVEALSDRIAIMQKGKVRAVGTIQEVLENTATESLEDAFVVLHEE